MESSARIKEQMIQEYIKNIDFKGDFSVVTIKKELKKILHEIPAVEIKYTKTKMVKEDKKGNKIETLDEKVKSIIIAFSDGEDSNGNVNVHRVELYT